MYLLESDLSSAPTVPRGDEEAARSELGRLAVRAIPIAVAVLILNEVFGAVVRFVCVNIGAPWLSYAPSLFASAVLLAAVATVRFPRGIWVLFSFFAVQALYTLVLAASTRNESLRVHAAQLGFALYTWTAFFLGVIATAHRQERVLLRCAGACWVFAVLGVLVNRYVAFPWMETNFEVLGQELQVARDWATNGIARLSGFSRASFSAANQIAVFGVVLLSVGGRPVLVQVAIWAVSLLAIGLTTSKTPLASVVLTPLAIYLVRALRSSKRFGALAFPAAMTVLAVLMGLIVLLPLSSSLVELLAKGPFEDYGFLTLSSLLDRAATMWPGAFDLVARDRAPVEWLLGRGLGGIGAAQAIFEPLTANSADNLFVFLYVTFGLGCVLFGLGSLLGFKRLYAAEPETFELIFALALAVLTLGLATNVIESIVPALASGVVVGKGLFAVSAGGAPGAAFEWLGPERLGEATRSSD